MSVHLYKPGLHYPEFHYSINASLGYKLGSHPPLHVAVIKEKINLPHIHVNIFRNYASTAWRPRKKIRANYELVQQGAELHVRTGDYRCREIDNAFYYRPVDFAQLTTIAVYPAKPLRDAVIFCIKNSDPAMGKITWTEVPGQGWYGENFLGFTTYRIRKTLLGKFTCERRTDENIMKNNWVDLGKKFPHQNSFAGACQLCQKDHDEFRASYYQNKPFMQPPPFFLPVCYSPTESFGRRLIFRRALKSGTIYLDELHYLRINSRGRKIWTMPRKITNNTNA